MSRVAFPGGAGFAFTILDDTDDSTVEGVKPIYDLLADLGFRTTKTVWPVACPEGSKNFFAGDTLADDGYRRFVQDLAERGFEIAFHGATMESSLRPRTEEALERFCELFGGYPRVHCNHAQNRENLYWGSNRYRTSLARAVRSLARWRRREREYEGHVRGSPYFWGDLARSHVDYVRNFAFRRLDVSRIYPGLPYSLPDTPYVKRWFHTADAPDAPAFNRLVTRERVDALVRSGGYSIISTHLGKRFVVNGVVDSGVRERLEYIASKNGWFVPVSELLDHLGEATPGRVRFAAVELSHLLDRIFS